LRVALVGNPNAGKTTLFNALTGLRHKVANYPGVTVEKKEGRSSLLDGNEASILDLPGAYSLSPTSPDEEITRDVLIGVQPDVPRPDVLAIVLDASNLERNLYLATQVLEVGLPSVIALNMGDVARAQGIEIDARELSRELGVPVVPCVAVRNEGLDDLRRALARAAREHEHRSLELTLSPSSQALREEASQVLGASRGGVSAASSALAWRALSDVRNADAADIDVSNDERSGANDVSRALARAMSEEARRSVALLRERAAAQGLDLAADEARARHEMVRGIAHRVTQRAQSDDHRSFSDRLDAVLLHPFWGMGVFTFITLLVFQAIYSWAGAPMDALDSVVSGLGAAVEAALPAGPLRDLIVQGAIAGVGAVVVFIPQIAILFFFIGILEDTGYMARAALLMDRLMSKVGLHARAFIPLVSSFACAIPGIMAARTISSPRDRLATILIAPLMTCSARLPVYALMIGTFIPEQKVLGVFSSRALTLLSLYAAGVIIALVMAWIFKRTLLKGPPPALVLELPAYKMPGWRNIAVTVFERSWQFIARAGTVILSLSIVLWFALNYPKVDAAPPTRATPNVVPAQGIDPGPGGAPEIRAEPQAEEEASRQVRGSFAGRLGGLIEPVIAPLGFNWKIGIGLIGAMSAREVFVSTLGTVYSVADADETSDGLREQMKRDKWPDGRPVWTTLTAASLLMYFVIAMQCISTLAIVKRETNGWKWPMFMLVYLTVLAWVASFVVYQGGRALGWG
jgi:ferrous iron transport protein B